MLFAIFLAIHVMRTDAQWSFIGFISPVAALVGDAVVAILLAILLALPLRLAWRRLSRPIERAAWNRLHHMQEANLSLSFAGKAIKYWLERRMRLAIEMHEFRNSPNFALWRVLRIGLPLTAILIAVNSIWGFSWYFNSENWASGGVAGDYQRARRSLAQADDGGRGKGCAGQRHRAGTKCSR